MLGFLLLRMVLNRLSMLSAALGTMTYLTLRFMRWESKVFTRKYSSLSLVKLLHIPSGIEVQCDAYRAQYKNRDAAWNRLKSLIYAKEKGIVPSTDVIRTYTLPEGAEYPDDLVGYSKEVK